MGHHIDLIGQCKLNMDKLGASVIKCVINYWLNTYIYSAKPDFKYFEYLHVGMGTVLFTLEIVNSYLKFYYEFWT